MCGCVSVKLIGERVRASQGGAASCVMFCCQRSCAVRGLSQSGRENVARTRLYERYLALNALNIVAIGSRLGHGDVYVDL